MESCQLNRVDFGSLVSEVTAGVPITVPVRSGPPDSAPKAHRLWACWDDELPKDDSLPALVVVGDEDVTDFLAWAVTFLPAFRPLTSFLRVLPWTVFSLVQERRRGGDVEISAALVGGILGETLTNATGRGFIESLPLTAFESTYSYALSRMLSIGLNPKILQYVSDGWHDVREFTDQPTRRIPRDSLEEIWSVVLRLAGGKRVVSPSAAHEDRIGHIEEACREIRDSGSVSSFNWHRLSGGGISNSAIADSMSSTKEHRVEAFEETARLLSKQVSDELCTSFLVGYLASLVSDGSLEHAHLIFPLQDQLPTAMLWYGICAGLLPKNRVRTDYSHLGLRILRSLKRMDGLLSPPTCDISLSELEVLLRGDPRSRSFRQTHASLLRVELAPMVTTVLRWPGRQAGVSQLGLFSVDDRQLQLETDRLRELIAGLRGSLSIAESLLGSQPSPSWSVGYPSRGKRRR